MFGSGSGEEISARKEESIAIGGGIGNELGKVAWSYWAG